ncbi:hypothetical protein ABIC02_007401 [Bradyrhizobium sp. RT5a]
MSLPLPNGSTEGVMHTPLIRRGPKGGAVPRDGGQIGQKLVLAFRVAVIKPERFYPDAHLVPTAVALSQRSVDLDYHFVDAE